MRRFQPAIFTVGIAAAFAVTACDAAEEDYLFGVDEAVAAELERLGVEPTADAEVHEETLPEDLGAEPQWGVVEGACEEGGYDLEPFAGQTVTLTGVEIAGSCQDAPIRAWVISQGEVIACAYLSIREGGTMTPGVWPVDSAWCDY